ncbi:hypothetical protein DK261_02430 [Pseudomonas sp. RW409]|nr:hypothetical protein DK261_02430 [Pseudomonas sp. RW409]
MKGRRKAKNVRLELIRRFEQEARLAAPCPSRNQRRFIQVAMAKGRDLEPLGRMAETGVIS